MRIFSLIFFCLFLVNISLAQQLVEGIVAVVGKEIILKSEIDQNVQQYIMQNRIDVNKNKKLIAELRQKTIDMMIEQKILLAKAEEDTVTVDDAMLDARLEERIRYLVQLPQIGSESKLEEVFGSPMKKIRKDTRKLLKEQMLVEQVRANKFRGIKVSRREVEEFYKAYKDSLPRLNETVDISHILMLVEASDDAKMKAYEKAAGILEQIKNGADFGELAQKYSDDPASAKRGGDLGFISRGDFVNEFETVAFNLKENEISDIVQTQFGFHIIQLLERRGEKVRTRHILIRVAPQENDEQRVIEKLRELRQRILDGEDFSELALKYSDDENVTKDKGHLGVFETDKLVIPQFQSVVKNLKVGQISEPFKTEFGYHIVRLNDRKASRTLSLENDWQQIEEVARNFKTEREYRKWMQELRDNINIEIRNPG